MNTTLVTTGGGHRDQKTRISSRIGWKNRKKTLLTTKLTNRHLNGSDKFKPVLVPISHLTKSEQIGPTAYLSPMLNF